MMSLIKSCVKSSQYIIYSSDLNLIKSCVIIYTAVATCSQPCDVKLVVSKLDASGQKSYIRLVLHDLKIIIVFITYMSI